MLTNRLPFRAAFAAFALSTLAAFAQPILQDGDTLAFLGDSITQFGKDTPSGYVRLVLSGLEANGIKVTPIFAGISGHKSNDMLARVDRDVLDKDPKPAVMTLSCGVNDVWHGARGVELEPYKENITQILDKAIAAGVKPVILTATMIREDAGNNENRKLAAYNDFLRELAAERDLPLADLNADMQAAIAAAKESGAARDNGGNYLTSDGVHMAAPGNRLMAVGVLRALGLDDGQIEKAKEAWLDIPNAVRMNLGPLLTLREYDAVAVKAAAEGKTVQQFLTDLVQDAVK
ncbi:MAG: SGNH/GDSL hydrolase family protein [Kiritimatiellia bacterium]|jgi:lysophospholipase L1-like esterase